MELMPNFSLRRPKSIEEAVSIWANEDDARYFAGGTDLLVNIRRGIENPVVLISLELIPELSCVRDCLHTLQIGAVVSLRELAENKIIRENYPAVSEAAESVAGPTHRNYGTVGGNLLLDTRCIYYNQSEWWRRANNFCLKHRGDTCHVAPGGKRCFATFSGDLAPAMLVYEAEAELIGPDERRKVLLADLYNDDGLDHLAMRPGEILVSVSLPKVRAKLASGYEKSRIRGAIDFPLAGVAVCLVPASPNKPNIRIGLTGVSPRPVVVTGLSSISDSIADQIETDFVRTRVQTQAKAMKTTITPPHYRRRVAGALARRLVERLAG